MSFQQVSPKKLKDLLTRFRESISLVEAACSVTGSDIVDSESSASCAFVLLLLCELASRRVQVDLPSSWSALSTDWTIHLLHTIQSIAGKIAIDNNDDNDAEFPAPLLAALNAASGMAACACAGILAQSQECGNSSERALSLLSRDTAVREVWRGACKRCLEVRDGRFYTLLMFATDEFSWIPCDSTSVLSSGPMMHLQRYLYTVAYASFLYGATQFAIDQPPIWKRCLDVAVLISSNNVRRTNNTQNVFSHHEYRNSLSILPIKNLIRIAQSKNNLKRVKELSLLLVMGFIGAIEEKLNSIRGEVAKLKLILNNSAREEDPLFDGNDIAKLSMHQLLQYYFLDRTSIFLDVKRESIDSLMYSAREALLQVPTPASIPTLTIVSVTAEDGADATEHEMELLYSYLQTQIEYLGEESKIWLDIQQQYSSMKNRMPESTRGGVSKVGISPSGDTGKSKLASTMPLKSSSSMAALTMTASTKIKEDVEKEARRVVYLEAWDAWRADYPDDNLEALVITVLRDRIVGILTVQPGLPASFDIVQHSYGLLTHQVNRLVEMALILQKRTYNRGGKEKDNFSSDVLLAWRAVFLFISPLIVNHLVKVVNQENAMSRMDEEFRGLVECTSEAIVTAAWMCEPILISKTSTNELGSRDTIFDDVPQLLSMALDCLLACQRLRSTNEQELLESTREHSRLLSEDTRSESLKVKLFKFNCTLAALNNRINIFRTDRENSINTEVSEEVSVELLTDVAHKASSSAIAAANLYNVKVGSHSAMSTYALLGTAYLQFLSSWSGMHLTPWPFCTLGQARSILRLARESLSLACKVWGRELKCEEQLLLNVAEADLESNFNGGFVQDGRRLYDQTLGSIASSGEISLAMEMLKVHCLLGLAKMDLSSSDTQPSVPAQVERYARKALDILNRLDGLRIKTQSGYSLLCIYPWDYTSLSKFSILYNKCISRQLVAEACIRSSRPDDARSFLLDAVCDLPKNFDAAFALAAFCLRKMLFICRNSENFDAERNEAKIQLLKAAKLDKGMPSTFALLGLFYEHENDKVRAKACYQKALSIDQSHPVAGRGLRRLVTIEELLPWCETAVEQNSPVNGWAWRTLGQFRLWKDGDNNSASICFQRALRCHDVQHPESQILGVFYKNPKTDDWSYCEVGAVWSELADCYRQLGKWSAALRAYNSAYVMSDGDLSPNALIAWAQVELELGLYDEALKICNNALSLNNHPDFQRLASFVKGKIALALAKRDIQDGKFGLCMSHIEMGMLVRGMTYCEQKLLGDLYSVCEALPPYVFSTDKFSSEGIQIQDRGKIQDEFERKLSFLSKGETAYTSALEFARNEYTDEEEKNYLVSVAATDLGTNLLSQARVLFLALGEGGGGGSMMSIFDLVSQSRRIQNIVKKSINAYTCAIDLCPHEAPAWCGIGCALVTIDPLLAQHAFCRALQIDKSLAQAWSNIAVLYADYDLREKSSEVLDALTQDEDTPFMWICRGLLFEKASDAWRENISSRETNLSKAADAYRAALKIVQHPAALFGLALTCQRINVRPIPSSDHLYSKLIERSSKEEARISVSIHQSMTDGRNLGAYYVDHFMRIEENLDQISTSNNVVIKDIMERVTERMVRVNQQFGKVENTTLESISDIVECDINFDIETSPKIKNTGVLPIEAIKDAIVKIASATTCNGLREKEPRVNLDIDDIRNIVFLNPDSGEAWLNLAKALTRELSNFSDGSKERHFSSIAEALACAKTAALKAFNTLYSSVIHASLISHRTHHPLEMSIELHSERNVISAVAPTSVVSEAMSLLSWLENVDRILNGDSADKRTIVLLQESLLLNPLNKLSAVALKLTSNSINGHII